MSELRNYLESEFSNLFENIRNAVILIKVLQKTEMYFCKANTYFFLETGFQEEQFINKRLSDILKKASLKKIMLKILALNPESAEIHFKHKFTVPKGELTYIINLRGIFDEGSNLIYLVSKFQQKVDDKKLFHSISAYKNLTNISKIGGWEIDLLKGKVYWTEELYKLHETGSGFKPNLKNILSFYRKAEIDKIIKKFYKVKNNKNFCDDILLLTTQKGKKRWIRLIGEVQFIKDLPIRVYGILQDISEEIKLQQQVQIEQKKLKDILETQKELICRSKPDTTIVFVNYAYANFFHSTPEQLIGKKFMNWVPEEDRKYLSDSFNKLSWENPIIETEHQVMSDDGSFRWMTWTDYGIFDDYGKLLEIQSNGKDITDKKSLELEIEQREKLYHNLIESTAHSILLINNLGDIKYLNSNLGKLLNVEYQDIIETNISQWTKHNKENIIKLLNRIKSKSDIINFEIKIKDAEKREKDCEAYISNMESSRGNQLFLISLNDITEKKQNQANQFEIERLVNQSARLSTISALSAGIIHEINQPLNAIKLIVEGLIYLENKDVNKFNTTIKDKLKFISEQTRRVESIISNLKGMTFDKPEFEASRFDLNSSLMNVLKIFKTRISAMQVNIEYTNNINRLIKSYPLQIEQIMINIIKNALDSLEEEKNINNKKISIYLGFRKDKILIRVANRGPKIAESALKRIFEPFFTTKISEKGTGLGLAICQQIINTIGGSIQVKNLEPSGVAFLVNFTELKE